MSEGRSPGAYLLWVWSYAERAGVLPRAHQNIEWYQESETNSHREYVR